jgi:hypothetical protein
VRRVEKGVKSISIKKLVEELQNREGVKLTEVPPYEEKSVPTAGLSIIIEIIDR